MSRTCIERVLREKLARFPELSLQSEKGRFEVAPPDGFSVWALQEGPRYVVGFEGWHEPFDTLDEAVACFGWGFEC